MSSKNIKFSSIAFVVVLALSGLSFGFLVGRSQQHSKVEATEQFQAMTSQVSSGGAFMVRAVRGVRNLLIQ